MPKNWNLGLLRYASDIPDYNPHYESLSKLIETDLHHESGVMAKSMFKSFNDNLLGRSTKAQRQRFLDSLTPFEQKIFDEVAYPKGFKRIRYFTIDGFMNREFRKIDAKRADTPEFIDVIRRNS